LRLGKSGFPDLGIRGQPEEPMRLSLATVPVVPVQDDSLTMKGYHMFTKKRVKHGRR
jgi:hypothetical protein